MNLAAAPDKVKSALTVLKQYVYNQLTAPARRGITRDMNSIPK